MDVGESLQRLKIEIYNYINVETNVTLQKAKLEE